MTAILLKFVSDPDYLNAALQLSEEVYNFHASTKLLQSHITGIMDLLTMKTTLAQQPQVATAILGAVPEAADAAEWVIESSNILINSIHATPNLVMLLNLNLPDINTEILPQLRYAKDFVLWAPIRSAETLAFLHGVADTAFMHCVPNQGFPGTAPAAVTGFIGLHPTPSWYLSPSIVPPDIITAFKIARITGLDPSIPVFTVKIDAAFQAINGTTVLQSLLS